MTASCVVFVGPTVTENEVRKSLDATIMPPAAVGDVYRAVLAAPSAIVVIDGYFERVPAVWHKEILFALSRGITVVGCSSMGALRAAELSSFGMHGSGDIFQMYLEGVLEDDDEVAVIHADADSGYRACSDAMVNIRHGLALAAAEGIIGADAAARLEFTAKGWFYPDRHWASLLETAERDRLPGASALRKFIRDARPNLKRADAIATLDGVASGCFAPRPLKAAFERTDAWTWLERLETART